MRLPFHCIMKLYLPQHLPLALLLPSKRHVVWAPLFLQTSFSGFEENSLWGGISNLHLVHQRIIALHSLHIVQHQFLHCPGFSPSTLLGYVLELIVVSLSLGLETLEQFSETLCIFIHPSFNSYSEWEASLHL